LQDLQIDLNHLSSLTISSQLPLLASLRAGGMPIRDFSFLRKLPALTELYLESYPFVDLQLPEGLTNLLKLDLSYGSFTRLTFPRRLCGPRLLCIFRERPQ